MEKLMKVKDAADILCITQHTIRRWALAGKIPHVKLPSGGIRFKESSLEEYATEVGNGKKKATHT